MVAASTRPVTIAGAAGSCGLANPLCHDSEVEDVNNRRRRLYPPASCGDRRCPQLLRDANQIQDIDNPVAIHIAGSVAVPLR